MNSKTEPTLTYLSKEEARAICKLTKLSPIELNKICGRKNKFIHVIISSKEYQDMGKTASQLIAHHFPTETLKVIKNKKKLSWLQSLPAKRNKVSKKRKPRMKNNLSIVQKRVIAKETIEKNLKNVLRERINTNFKLRKADIKLIAKDLSDMIFN